MGVVDSLKNFLTLPSWQSVETRSVDPWSDVPDLATQLARIQGAPRPWRLPTINEALGVPAIQRAVTLIANTVGSLEIEAFRSGVRLGETPRLLSRPDPYWTPREFKRDTAWNMATRGEFVWWIAARDTDRLASALVVVPLNELSIEPNPDNRLRPVYKWGRIQSTRWSPATPDGQFVHGTYAKDPGDLRGKGPLQMCQAAISVSVEAQEWAANFYSSGGNPSVILQATTELSEDEADAARAAWIANPANTPQVIDNQWEKPEALDRDPQGAQMLEGRDYQNGEAARMFGIPGSLLDYSTPGSSLTYQNVEGEYTKWIRSGLSINYLEPIEQALTDLQSGTTVARFNVNGLQRADRKTRMETYALGVPLGVIPLEEAQREEGVIPGSVETAPVPFAPPAAIPDSIPETRADRGDVRCIGTRKRRIAGAIQIVRCEKLLSTTGVFVGRCPRCKREYAAAA